MNTVEYQMFIKQKICACSERYEKNWISSKYEMGFLRGTFWSLYTYVEYIKYINAVVRNFMFFWPCISI